MHAWTRFQEEYEKFIDDRKVAMRRLGSKNQKLTRPRAGTPADPFIYKIPPILILAAAAYIARPFFFRKNFAFIKVSFTKLQVDRIIQSKVGVSDLLGKYQLLLITKRAPVYLLL